MIVEFVKDVIESVNPLNYSKLCLFPTSRAISFFSKLLFASYIIFVLLMIPTFMDLPSSVSEEFKGIHLDVNGNFTSDKIIRIPSTGFIVVDTNATKLVKNSRFTLTKDSIYFKPPWTTTQKIDYDEFKKPADNEEKIASLTSFATILLSPIILVTIYLWFWIKYFLLALLFGTLVYLAMDLTSYSMSYQKTLTTAFFNLIWIVPLELILTAFDTNYLIKLVSVSGIPLYAISTIIYLTLFLVSTAFAAIENKKKMKIGWESKQ